MVAAASTKSSKTNSKAPKASVKTTAKASKTSDKKNLKESPKKSSHKPSTTSIIEASIETSKSKIDTKQLQRAIDALLKHESKKKDESKELIESDIPVHIQIGLLKAPSYAGPKPHRILLPHSIRTDDDEQPEVCIIVKDSSKEWLQELLPHFPDHMGCVKKILTLTSLRTKHHTFAQRRVLASKYSHFLGDDRILPMLPASLGKDFYRHHKIIPISITRKEALPFTVLRAMQSTHLRESKGTCWTIPIGTIRHGPSKLMENGLASIAQCVEHVPQRWKNLLNLSLKTPKSVALPFYNKLPEELLDLSTLRSQAEIEREEAARKKEEAEKKKEGKKALAAKKEQKRSLMSEKSPLLRALKKQKAEAKGTSATAQDESDATAEENDEESEGTEAKERNVSTKRNQPQQEVGSQKGKVNEAPSKEKNSAAKKVKSARGKTEKDPLVDKEAPAATPLKKLAKDSKTGSKLVSAKKEKDETPSKKSKAQEATDSTESSRKKVKPSTTELTPKTTTNGNEPFLASKKFTGSKAGYVFKKGPKGLGYYKDQPPIVDRMAMEAILRMAKEGRNSGSGRKPKHAKGGGGSKGKKHSRGRR